MTFLFLTMYIYVQMMKYIQQIVHQHLLLRLPSPRTLVSVMDGTFPLIEAFTPKSTIITKIKTNKNDISIPYNVYICTNDEVYPANSQSKFIITIL